MHRILRQIVLLIGFLLIGNTLSYAQDNPYAIDAHVAPYLQRLNSVPNGNQMVVALDSMEAVAKHYKDEKAQSIASFYRVVVCLTKYDVSRAEAERSVEQCIAFCRKTGYMPYAYGALRHAAETMTVRHRYTEASAYIARLTALGDELHDANALHYAYHSMGNVYKQLELYRLAIESYRRALDVCDEKSPANRAANAARGLADTYRLMGEHTDSARYYILYALKTNQVANHYEELLQAQYTIPYNNENRDIIDSLCLISDSLERTTPSLRQRNLESWLLAQSNIAFGNSDYQRVIDLYHQQEASHNAPKNARTLMTSYIHLGHPDSALFLADRLRENVFSEEEAVHMLLMEEERTQAQKTYELQRLNVLHNKQALELLTLQQAAAQLQHINDERDRSLLAMQVSEEEAKNALLQSLMEQEKDSLEHIQQLVQQYEAQTRQHNWAWAFIALLMSAAMLVSAIFLWRQYKSKRRERRLAKMMQAEVHAATLAQARALKSESLKSVFLQNMNHEIRAPLAAVVSFNELLNSDMRDSLSTEEQQSIAELVHHNSELLITLIDDVINISDLQNNNYQIKLRSIDAGHLCAQVAHSLNWRVPEGVRLLVKGCDSLLINTDSARLQQVLFNLLTNACKHTGQGSITISCQPFDDVDDTPWVRFVVEDTGCGIPDDRVNRLFDRFDTLDTLKPGNGLGLNICYRISQLMKGRLYYDRSYRQGARFVFEQMRNLTLALMAFFSLSAAAQQDQYDSTQMMYKSNIAYMQKVASRRTQWAYYPMCDTLEQMGVEKKDTGAICAAYFLRSSFAIYAQKPDLMVSNALKTMHVSRGTPWDVRGYSALNMAVGYFSANHKLKLAQQLCDTLEHYAALETTNRSYYNLIALRARATALEGMGLYQMALGKLKQGVDELDKNAFRTSLSTAYHSLMTLYEKVGKLDSAYVFGLEAVRHTSNDNNRMISLYELIILYRRGLYPVDSLLSFHHQFDSLAHIVMAPEARPRFYLADANYYIHTNQLERADSLLNAVRVRPTRHWRLKYDYFREKQQWDSAFYYSMQLLSNVRLTREKTMLDMRREAENQHEGIQQETRRQQLEGSILQQERLRVELDLLHAEQEQEAVAKEQMLVRQRLATVNEQKSQRDQERIAQRLHTQRQREQLKADEYTRYRATRYTIAIIVVIVVIILIVVLFAILTALSRRKLRHMLNQLKQRRHEAILAQRKAEEADRERTHFLQTISHEVRTPLNAIIGFTDCLNNGENIDLTVQQRQFMMERINHYTHYLNTMVENLLFLSKLESGTYRPNLSSTTVGDILTAALTTVRGICPEGVSLHADGTPTDAQTVLQTDVYALGRLLNVLLDNACKFTTQGSITLQYKSLTLNGSPWMEFAVADTGTGIKNEDVDKLFVKSFYKGDEFKEGVGMGLSIARLLSHVLRGSISLDDTYAPGARFVLRIPQ